MNSDRIKILREIQQAHELGPHHGVRHDLRDGRVGG